MGIYKRVANLLPPGLVIAFKKELDYLGIEISGKRFVGFLLLYILFLSLGLALNFNLFFKVDFFLSFIFFFCLFFGGVYLWLSITAESKGKFVERILPDALQLIASNVKSGLTTERALIVSARPEFGPLEVELKRASREIMAGERMDKALLKIPERIKSPVLEKTLWLVSKGISSGGQIADLLLQLSDDLREQNAIKAEVRADISMYILLIFFAAAFGAPVLYGVSSFIVQVMAMQMENIPEMPADMSTAAAGGAAGVIGMVGVGKGTPIPVDFILFFIMVSLATTSIFASMVMGIINTGKEKGGAKFVPIILFIAFSLFFIIRLVLASIFGGLLL